MSKRLRCPAAWILTGAAAVIGAILRQGVLRHALDDGGLPIAGNYLPLAMALFLLAMLAALALLLGTLEKRSTFFDNFSAKPGWLIPQAVSALALLAGSGLPYSATADTLHQAVCCLGVASGILLLVQTALQTAGKKQSFLLLLVPCLWLILRLICSYKDWSSDPVLLDYCFLLLSHITGMLAVYHIAGFSFDRGHRRLTAFWCGCTVILSAVSVPDALCSGDTAELLLLLGMIGWCGTALLQLCARRTAPDADAPQTT